MKENKETERKLVLHHAFWKSSVLLKDSEVAVTTVTTFQDIRENVQYKAYPSKPLD